MVVCTVSFFSNFFISLVILEKAFNWLIGVNLIFVLFFVDQSTIMSVVILAPEKRALLIQEILSSMIAMPIRLAHEVDKVDAVQYAIVWKHQKGALQAFKSLALICSFGAGVDHLWADPTLPPHVPIVRIGDGGLATTMSRYIQAALANWEQNLFTYQKQQNQKNWQPLPVRTKPKIGILGLGTIGKRVALDLVEQGYKVSGYSNSLKNIDGVKNYAGQANLKFFLNGITCLICLLPLTSNTKGMVGASMLKELPKGSFFINVARGAVVIEADLLEALNSGKLAVALLDVFNQEPLPKNHPFWEHPQIIITPHVAAVTDPVAACKEIAENIKRSRAGLPLLYEVNKEKGY